MGDANFSFDPPKYMGKMSNNWSIGQLDCEWMSFETFYEYITNVFSSIVNITL